MFRYFESLVDPYASYAEDDTPPDRLLPFLKEYLRPARRVMVWTVLSILAVARDRDRADLVRRAAGRPAGATCPPPRSGTATGSNSRWSALFILLLRPVIQTLSALFLNQSLMPNVGTIVRWRSHRHVLRQSVGWFQNDFAGRIANRMMQTAPAVGEATFQTFDAWSTPRSTSSARSGCSATPTRGWRCRSSSGSGSTSGSSPGRCRGSGAPRRRSPTPARRSPGGSWTATPTSSR